jgi:DNA modification methylase
MTLEPGLSRVRLDQLHESPVNPRSITPDAFERLQKALAEAPEMLEARPIIATLDGEVICGNMRHRALSAMLAGAEPDDDPQPVEDTWVFAADLNENEKREWMLRDNNEYGDWVEDELSALMAAHREAGGDLDLLGFAQPEVDDLLRRADADGGGSVGVPRSSGPSLADRFGVPPFSVIDSRTFSWRERKRSWLGLGIKSELGREGVVGSISSGDPSAGDPQFYDKKTLVENELGRRLDNQEFIRDHYTDPRGGEGTSLAKNSISVFDPMLCELVYRWFSGEGQLVIDPFAGGSVRGVVAGRMKRGYVGVDLQLEQVAANCEQADAILTLGEDFMPVWVNGDARDAESLEPGGEGRTIGDTEYDLLFTCPPYFNLEVYSEDERDLSRAASWDAFLAGYRDCLAPAANLLRDDRFAVIVVGDIRQKDGRVLPLVAETQRVMEGLGFQLYNDAIYITPVGSLRIRAARYFVESRKLGRTHQHVLVFVKGSGKVAADAAGVVDQAALQEAVDVVAGDDEDATPEDE